ncbi:oligosaccharide flippase family protein [Ekhidna sp. To15]|uniref:oligosaccharide flippase family protein n=1 Tax=Ekhidna sp. To15 TaxID=3395267 RepID=UPI003F521E3F
MIFSSKVISQIISLIFTPILARVFLPEEYGYLTIFMLFVNIFISLGSLGYQEALAIAKEKKEFYKLFWLALFLFTIISIPYLFTFRWIIGYLDAVVISGNLVFVIWIGLMIFSIATLVNKWSVLENDFKIQAKNGLIGTIISKITSLILGLKGISLGLVFGEISLNVVMFTAYLRKYLVKERIILFQAMSLKNLVEVARKYSTYVTYYPLLNLIQRLSAQVILIAIISFYDVSALGNYSMAIGLVAIPINLLANSLYPVFLQKFNSMERNELTQFLEKTTRLVLLSLTIPAVLSLLITPSLLPIILGENWELSGKIAAILSIYIGHEILGVSMNSLLHSMDLKRLLFGFNLIRIAMVVLGLLLGFLFGNEITAMILGSSLGILIFNLGKIHYILRRFDSTGKLLNFVSFATIIICLIITINISN